MDQKLRNVGNIESFFDRILPKTITENIFYTNLPKTISSDWKTMMLVDCQSNYTHDAYAVGNVLIYLFAQPMATGMRDVATLSAMEDALTEAIEGAVDEHYHVRLGSTYADYDALRNLHCTILSIELMIF